MRANKKLYPNLLGAVSEVAADVELSLLAELHLNDTLIPAFDDATNTDGGLEGTAAGGAVELLALVAGASLEPASVFHGDLVALLWGGAVAL